ncbi:MAG: hypothetical protein N2578_03060 [Bdellovibrionaceae bacterium]|nr:hypothetical protein [Pseudobdellovibrionaceae bacterium]
MKTSQAVYNRPILLCMRLCLSAFFLTFVLIAQPLLAAPDSRPRKSPVRNDELIENRTNSNLEMQKSGTVLSRPSGPAPDRIAPLEEKKSHWLFGGGFGIGDISAPGDNLRFLSLSGKYEFQRDADSHWQIEAGVTTGNLVAWGGSVRWSWERPLFWAPYYRVGLVHFASAQELLATVTNISRYKILAALGSANSFLWTWRANSELAFAWGEGGALVMISLFWRP